MSEKRGKAVKISAAIITLNEERNIGRCLASLRGVADEIVVVDSGSTDRTREICLEHGARFVVHPFGGYRDQKNVALREARWDRVLSLDADEALSERLASSIRAVKADWRHDAYRFPRLNCFCGRWVRHTDWYPERKIRLLDRREGEWAGANIHEEIRMKPGSRVASLAGDLLHWRYRTPGDLLAEVDHFSTLSAREHFARGKKPSFMKIAVAPAWRFVHSYFVKRGFLEGYDGLFISRAIALQCQSKYLKLKVLYDEQNHGPSTFAFNHPQVARPGLRIGVDARAAFFGSGGSSDFSRGLINALARHDAGNNYLLFAPRAQGRQVLECEAATTLVPLRRLGATGLRGVAACRRIAKLGVDLYHGPDGELPYGIHKTGVKTVVTIHSLDFARRPDSRRQLAKARYACRHASRIVATSQRTKDDIVEQLGVDAARVAVIGLEAEPGRRVDAESLARFYAQLNAEVLAG